MNLLPLYPLFFEIGSSETSSTGLLAFIVVVLPVLVDDRLMPSSSIGDLDESTVEVEVLPWHERDLSLCGSGWWYFTRRPSKEGEFVTDLPHFNKNRKDQLFFVGESGWEFPVGDAGTHTP